MDPAWIIIFATILMSGFFSGVEIAYLTANKLRIELKNQRGVVNARVITYFFKHPSRFFTTILVGNNVALVVYSIYAALIITTFLTQFHIISEAHTKLLFLLQTLIGSFFILIFGEFLPKALFRISPNFMLNLLSMPLFLFYVLLWPLIFIIEMLSTGILKLFGTTLHSTEPEFTRHDLFHYVDESNASEEQDALDVDKEIFRNAIEFHALQVRECMIPRTEIAAIDISEPVSEAKKRFVESGHSKLPVYRDSIDNITGYIHLVDLFGNPKSIDKIVMPIIIATESMLASDLLKILIEKHRSVAIVVDEFGGTSGIVTIEDILEEIIGDIEDEHDVDDSIEKKISDNEFIFSARLDIDYLNETYNLGLPEGDYETLGGFIYSIHEDIPRANEVIILPPFEFIILTNEQTRIGEVKVRIVKD